ncbi:hypothetical protein [Actinomadura sp. HBU206391]|uniref:hypothetical protein n=1 Tax=Actinomadura sp. HBU206391 TaxID=2731692 RepID=UPI001650B33B|nr:hypothetical protein [Actinomadura sp. HBU206391]MBC6457230.1 hypothetical protein [Actinomadura sp. HBU206391]
MYAKPSIGLLAVAGAATMPTATPTFRVARLLLQITGVGFGLYCAGAVVLFLVGCWMRWRDAVERRRGDAVEGL